MKFLKSMIFVLFILVLVLLVLVFGLYLTPQANSAETKFAITGHEMKVYKSECFNAYKDTLALVDADELFEALYDIPSDVCPVQKMSDVRPSHVYVIKFKIENTEKNSEDGIMILYNERDDELYPAMYQLFRLSANDPYCYLILSFDDGKPTEQGNVIIGVKIRNTDGIITDEYMLTLPVFTGQDI